MEAEYRGKGTLVVGEREIPVDLHLSGHVQPIDGRYRWAGRVERNEQVSEIAAGRSRTVTVRTGDTYTAEGTLGEEDPWGGFRISGTGAPPFAVPTDPDEAVD